MISKSDQNTALDFSTNGDLKWYISVMTREYCKGLALYYKVNQWSPKGTE